MRIERLFHVLVLGGAAWSGACSEEGDPADTANPIGTGGSTNGSGGSAGGSGGSAGGGATGAAGGSGGTSHAGSAGAGSGGTGAGGSGSSGGSSGQGGDSDAARSDTGPLDAAAPDTAFDAGLMCSTPANPSDPCGCPCCWAGDGCTNEQPCCHGFCVSGDHGRGCCPIP